VLDEPTNHLDIKHQLFILEFLKKSGKTILLVMHDLNLAARCCDNIYLLYRGEVAAAGLAEEVLCPEHIARFFEVQGTVTQNQTGQRSFVLL
jgi:iron complex transport system ATP-binding protein